MLQLALLDDTQTSTVATATQSCTSPNSVTGVGTCTTSISSSWFASSNQHENDYVVTASVEVSYGSSPCSSTVAEALVTQEPEFDALVSAGMQAMFPHHPLLAGETLTVDISAFTNGQDLSVWVLEVAYDPAVLTYQSTSTDSAYTPAVVVVDAAAGTVSMSTSGLKSSTSVSDVTDPTWALR